MRRIWKKFISCSLTICMANGMCACKNNVQPVADVKEEAQKEELNLEKMEFTFTQNKNLVMNKRNIEVNVPEPVELDQSVEADFESTSYIPEGMETARQEDGKLVFGEDDREVVNNTFVYPYSCIANLEVVYDCGCMGQSSGFMISKKTLMTASHCMVCPEHSKCAKYVNAYFGWTPDHRYYAEAKGFTSVRYGSYFPNKRYEIYNDWAYLVLNEDLGYQVGWLGYNTGSQRKYEQIENLTFVAGYRDDVLKVSKGFIDTVDGDFLLHRIDDVEGNSGGPLFYYDSNKDDWIAVGIIIAENSNTNIAYRINGALVQQMGIDGCF